VVGLFDYDNDNDNDNDNDSVPGISVTTSALIAPAPRAPVGRVTRNPKNPNPAIAHAKPPRRQEDIKGFAQQSDCPMGEPNYFQNTLKFLGELGALA